MTNRLYDELRRMATIREGFVVRNLDGSQKTDGEANWAIEWLCRKAGLPVRYFHSLRHSFGTDAALFGVNPWRLRVVIVAADGKRTHARESESGPGGFATRQAAEAYIDAFHSTISRPCNDHAGLRGADVPPRPGLSRSLPTRVAATWQQKRLQ